MLRISGLNPFPHLDPTNFAFTLSGLAVAWALFRFRLLDIVPVARDKVIESMGDGVIVLDVQNRVRDINPAAEKLIGVDGKSAIGQHAEDILARWTGLAEHYRDVLVAQTELLVEGIGWIELRISPLYERGGRFSGRLMVLRDITERKRAEETIKYMAYHDALTGLPNRRLFSDRLNLALAHACRNQQKLVVMLLDLDNFKDINDTLGHTVGDQLLQVVGQRLTSVLRKGDTVARLGGDEFMLLLPEVTQEEDAAGVAQKILEAIREPFVFGGHELHVATSIGIALYPDDGEDGDTLMKNADIAMYRAKDQGRDNYQRYTPATKTQ